MADDFPNKPLEVCNEDQLKTYATLVLRAAEALKRGGLFPTFLTDVKILLDPTSATSTRLLEEVRTLLAHIENNPELFSPDESENPKRKVDPTKELRNYLFVSELETGIQALTARRQPISAESIASTIGELANKGRVGYDAELIKVFANEVNDSLATENVLKDSQAELTEKYDLGALNAASISRLMRAAFENREVLDEFELRNALGGALGEDRIQLLGLELSQEEIDDFTESIAKEIRGERLADQLTFEIAKSLAAKLNLDFKTSSNLARKISQQLLKPATENDSDLAPNAQGNNMPWEIDFDQLFLTVTEQAAQAIPEDHAVFSSPDPGLARQVKKDFVKDKCTAEIARVLATEMDTDSKSVSSLAKRLAENVLSPRRTQLEQLRDEIGERDLEKHIEEVETLERFLRDTGEAQIHCTDRFKELFTNDAQEQGRTQILQQAMAFLKEEKEAFSVIEQQASLRLRTMDCQKKILNAQIAQGHLANQKHFIGQVKDLRSSVEDDLSVFCVFLTKIRNSNFEKANLVFDLLLLRMEREAEKDGRVDYLIEKREDFGEVGQEGDASFDYWCLNRSMDFGNSKVINLVPSSGDSRSWTEFEKIGSKKELRGCKGFSAANDLESSYRTFLEDLCENSIEEERKRISSTLGVSNSENDVELLTKEKGEEFSEKLTTFFNPQAAIDEELSILMSIDNEIKIPKSSNLETFTWKNRAIFVELLKNATAMPARVLASIFMLFTPFILFGLGNPLKSLFKGSGKGFSLDPSVVIGTVAVAVCLVLLIVGFAKASGRALRKTQLIESAPLNWSPSIIGFWTRWGIGCVLGLWVLLSITSVLNYFVLVYESSKIRNEVVSFPSATELKFHFDKCDLDENGEVTEDERKKYIEGLSENNRERFEKLFPSGRFESPKKITELILPSAVRGNSQEEPPKIPNDFAGSTSGFGTENDSLNKNTAEQLKEIKKSIFVRLESVEQEADSLEELIAIDQDLCRIATFTVLCDFLSRAEISWNDFEENMKKRREDNPQDLLLEKRIEYAKPGLLHYLALEREVTAEFEGFFTKALETLNGEFTAALTTLDKKFSEIKQTLEKKDKDGVKLTDEENAKLEGINKSRATIDKFKIYALVMQATTGTDFSTKNYTLKTKNNEQEIAESKTLTKWIQDIAALDDAEVMKLVEDMHKQIKLEVDKDQNFVEFEKALQDTTIEQIEAGSAQDLTTLKIVKKEEGDTEKDLQKKNADLKKNMKVFLGQYGAGRFARLGLDEKIILLIREAKRKEKAPLTKQVVFAFARPVIEQSFLHAKKRALDDTAMESNDCFKIFDNRFLRGQKKKGDEPKNSENLISSPTRYLSWDNTVVFVFFIVALIISCLRWPEYLVINIPIVVMLITSTFCSFELVDNVHSSVSTDAWVKQILDDSEIKIDLRSSISSVPDCTFGVFDAMRYTSSWDPRDFNDPNGHYSPWWSITPCVILVVALVTCFLFARTTREKQIVVKRREANNYFKQGILSALQKAIARHNSETEKQLKNFLDNWAETTFRKLESVVENDWEIEQHKKENGMRDFEEQLSRLSLELKPLAEKKKLARNALVSVDSLTVSVSEKKEAENGDA